MNINSEYTNEEPSSSDIMDIAMAYIWDKFIEPQKKSLTEEDCEMVAVIGSSLKMIANQATAMENFEIEMPQTKKDYFRN